MSDGVRISAVKSRHEAIRWRRLAADATTQQTRNHLLALARECEVRAGDLIPIRAAQRKGAG
jgi:hypothetical protein